MGDEATRLAALRKALAEVSDFRRVCAKINARAEAGEYVGSLFLMPGYHQTRAQAAVKALLELYREPANG